MSFHSPERLLVDADPGSETDREKNHSRDLARVEAESNTREQRTHATYKNRDRFNLRRDEGDKVAKGDM